MEEPVSESDRNLDIITAEHAVLIPALQNVKSVMAYVEAVAVVIGSCHIHSVYETGENVKIYLNDKRFVDILVNNGVTILGRRMNVDYAVPRADKVVLSNVDPIVPDAVLMKLLSYYGSPVSAIIHEKIATNSEYSHIECGRRKVYMNIFPHKKMPSKVNFTYLDVCYRIDLHVESCDREVCETSVRAESERVTDANEDLIEVESNQSVKPNINELMPKKARQPTPKQLAYHNRGKNSLQPTSAVTAVKKIKRRARGGWYNAAKVKRMKKMNTLPQSPSKQGRVKRLAHSTAENGIRKISKIGKRRSRKAVDLEISTVEDIMDVPEQVEVARDLNGAEEQISFTNVLPTETVDTRSVTQYPLSMEDLEKFMFKTRFHREPVQVAMEFLSNDKSPEVLSALKTQLLEYHNVCKDVSLKLRIKRLVSALKISTEAAD